MQEEFLPLTSGGSGEAAALGHHASGGPVQATLGRVYFGTVLRELRRSTAALFMRSTLKVLPGAELLPAITDKQ